MAKRSNFKTVDEYIGTFPTETQIILEELRKVIKDEIPGCEEVISYQIAAFKKDKHYIIYFAGYKTHVGLYPVHPDEMPMEKELEQYASGAASVRFPLDKPLPYPLIKKIVKYKLAKALEKDSTSSYK